MQSGFQTNSVVYHLRGGIKAQQRFYADRITAIHRIHHIHVHPADITHTPTISFIKSGTSPLADEMRYWMINPFNTRLTEYISVPETIPNSEKDAVTKPLENSNGDPFGDDHSETDDEFKASSDTRRIRRRSVRFAQIVSSDTDSEPEELEDHGDSTPKGITTNVPPAVSGAGQDEPYPFHCRCGIHGNGHTVSNGEPTIQCDECEEWSHVACQRNGRASLLKVKDRFVCDGCDHSHLMPASSSSRR
jgi:hypothetical protein